MKAVLKLKLGVAAPAPNTTHPGHCDARPAHHCGREPWELVLATNPFEHHFEFCGAPRLLLLGAESKPSRDVRPSQSAPTEQNETTRFAPCDPLFAHQVSSTRARRALMTASVIPTSNATTAAGNQSQNAGIARTAQYAVPSPATALC